MAKGQPGGPAERERGATPPAGGGPVILDWNSFQLICERLAETGGKYRSCEDLGFNYSTVASVIKTREDAGDDSWRDLWTESYNKYRESLEMEARKRARDGTPTEFKPVPGPDGSVQLVPVKVEYSDRLLELLVTAAFPERFRKNLHHSGAIGLEPIDAFSNLSHKAKRQIRQIIMEDLAEQRKLAQDRVRERVDGAVIDVEASSVQLLEDGRGDA